MKVGNDTGKCGDKGRKRQMETEMEFSSICLFHDGWI